MLLKKENKSFKIINQLKKVLANQLLSQKSKVNLCEKVLDNCEKITGNAGTLYIIGNKNKAVVIPLSIDFVLFFEDFDKAINYFIKINN